MYYLDPGKDIIQQVLMGKACWRGLYLQGKIHLPYPVISVIFCGNMNFYTHIYILLLKLLFCLIFCCFVLLYIYICVCVCTVVALVSGSCPKVKNISQLNMVRPMIVYYELYHYICFLTLVVFLSFLSLLGVDFSMT